jgi:hypothetical protein
MGSRPRLAGRRGGAPASHGVQRKRRPGGTVNETPTVGGSSTFGPDRARYARAEGLWVVVLGRLAARRSWVARAGRRCGGARARWRVSAGRQRERETSDARGCQLEPRRRWPAAS